MSTAPDAGISTLHIRCGGDLKPLLRAAWFAGDYLEYSNPLCQGPVPAGEDWLARRADFVARAYGKYIGRDRPAILADLEEAERALHRAPARYERVVLWFEHDSYDQSILARCLAAFADSPPRVLELVCVDRYPGVDRFIGLGQLPAAAMRPLWDGRQAVTAEQRAAGARIWDIMRAATPQPLARAAQAGIAALPFAAAALRRHCQEFPWLEDGLSLTERLVLEVLAEAPTTAGRVFAALVREREPLPFLGDIMLGFILECMKATNPAVLVGAGVAPGEPWYREVLTLTDTGGAVLSGKRDYLTLGPPVRFLGGATIDPAAANWRWDEARSALVLVPV